MENNLSKSDHRGQFMVAAWHEAKKAGGIAYSPEQVDAILDDGGDESMMERMEVKGRISAYIQGCLTVSQDDSGGTTYLWKRNPTKSGLALALGVSPQTLIDYVKGSDRHGNVYKLEHAGKTKQRIDTKDFDLIRKAYTLIEDFYEQKLGDNRNNAGVIFWLNNRENTRWSNQQEFTFSTNNVPKVEVESTSEIAKKYGISNIEGMPDESEVAFDEV